MSENSYIYDLDRMKEDVRPIDVAAYLNLKTTHSGRNTFIECPEHPERVGRNDVHATNCVLGKTWNNAYYCYSCGAKGSVLDLIAHVKGLERKSNFRKICEIAIASIGKPDDYRISVKDNEKNYYNRRHEAEKIFEPLSDDQYALIGLKKIFTVKSVKDAVSLDQLSDEEKELLTRHFVFKEGWKKETEFIELDERSFSISDIIVNDPDMYYQIIKTACEKKRNEINYLISCGVDRINEEQNLKLNRSDIQMIKSSLKQRYIEVKGIELQFDIVSDDPDWMK